MYRAAYTEQAPFKELATIAGSITRQSTGPAAPSPAAPSAKPSAPAATPDEPTSKPTPSAATPREPTTSLPPQPAAAPAKATPTATQPAKGPAAAKGPPAETQAVPRTVPSPVQEHPAGPAVGEAVQRIYEAQQRAILANEWRRIQADILANRPALEHWRRRGEWVALYVFVEVPAVPNIFSFVFREPWELPRYRCARIVHGRNAASVVRPPDTLEAPAPRKQFCTFQVLSPEEQRPYVPYGHQVVPLPGDFVNSDGNRTMHLELVEGKPQVTIRSVRGKLTVVAATPRLTTGAHPAARHGRSTTAAT